VIPLALAVAGAFFGFASDRLAARWPVHEDGSVRSIDWRTPVVTAFGAVAMAAVTIRYSGDIGEWLLMGAAFALLVPLMAIDLDQRLLPDPLTIPVAALGVIGIATGVDSLVKEPVVATVVTAVVLPVLLYLFSMPFGDGAFGEGDVKLLMGAGLLIGWLRLIMAVFTAALVSGVVIGVLLVARRISLKSYVPFGPFIIIGIVWAALLPAAS
jgi:leader peptidase (prepilin peptidase) / N-methyltransferase